MARLMDRYRSEIAPKLAAEMGRKNALAVPRLLKIVVNMGVGSAVQDRKRLDEAATHLGAITGQKPVITKAKAAISAFRLREGMEIGCKVTLRGQRMFEFMDRLVCLALPRVRDFQGLNPKAFDGHGNYSLGLNEQMVFPEIEADRVNFTQGMHVTFVTSSDSNDEARMLLKALGLPFATAEVKKR